MKDVLILVPDKNTQFALEGLLSRHLAFQIKPITKALYDIYVHPLRDPGVYKDAVNFMRPYQNQYRYALVFLDREGSGQENKPASQIANEIKNNLERNGWRDRAEAIVFDPELEIWAWVSSPHLAIHTGWNDLQSLLAFLQSQGFWEIGCHKPQRPKEAFEAALREKRIQRSSAIYKKIATDVNFHNCIETSFLKFQQILQNWFSTGEKHE